MLSLAATAEEGGRLTVYVVNYPLHYFTERIAGAHARVLLEGQAEIVTGPVKLEGEMYAIAAEMAERYGGAAGLDYLEGTKDEERYLLKLSPSKITSWRGPWHPRYGNDPREG